MRLNFSLALIQRNVLVLTVEAARQFAVQAHGNQHYGDKPYLYHLEKVVAHLGNYGEQAQIIGYLHDVVEDTDVSVDEIEVAFGKTVAACVSLVSDEPGADRQERKTKTYAIMKAVKPGAIDELGLLVKAADRLANLEECVLNSNLKQLEKYRHEHLHFREAVYREKLCDDLWEKIEAIISEA